ncbi:hypothetical protein QQY66_47530 [Streptomyces sp. DG2A-72]|uniref:hypothetical protein n=1 Tax=Streptomyces sp. DG2A-72 TaxID=3051386 RepID=UPI00265B8B0A|nr:hypothetical protein [Streptomyces sp. DG2A-72]MDO0939000.1 hypothetical protein [Streptomyces sp. DG2A-72]
MDPAAVSLSPAASISLRHLLMALGDSLVEVQVAPAGLDVEIRGVALLDPEDPPTAQAPSAPTAATPASSDRVG